MARGAALSMRLAGATVAGQAMEGMMQDWLWANAADLGRGIGAGQIDPVDLAEVYLEAIAGHHHADRIYARVTPERARAEAAAASKRARAGARRSALDGVPISWKDLYDTAGVVTEAGSGLLKGRVPAADARAVQNATAAGLVCLGKTHMTELAFSGLGLNPVTATPPNVHNPDVAPGGSSSGAATSVAFGLAAAGIGSDTGGSIRAPSVWNDLVGFKPAHGRLSAEGVVPLCPSFDTVGPLCRSVEDAALLFAALGPGPVPDLAGATLTGVRLLALDGLPLDEAEAPVKTGYAHAVARLESAGAEVVRADLPCVAEALSLAPKVFAPECYGLWRDKIEANPMVMHPLVRERFRGGGAVSAADFVDAWAALDQLRRVYAEALAGFDAAILPTCPLLPPVVAELEADDDYFVRANLLTLRNTRIANLLKLAAITLPTGLPATGIMLQAGPGREAQLLRLAVASERALAEKPQLTA